MTDLLKQWKWMAINYIVYMYYLCSTLFSLSVCIINPPNSNIAYTSMIYTFMLWSKYLLLLPSPFVSISCISYTSMRSTHSPPHKALCIISQHITSTYSFEKALLTVHTASLPMSSRSESVNDERL